MKRSGIMIEFNKNGNLNGGIIKGYSIDDIQKYFVDNFPLSQTRKRNFSGFKNFIIALENGQVHDIINKIWLDGSFFTNKLNPNDIDMVLLFNPSIDKIPKINFFFEEQKDYFRMVGEGLHCDTYYTLDYTLIPSSEPQVKQHYDKDNKYWMGQFGFDREGRNKGIIELTL